jgi:hypothetical protein
MARHQLAHRHERKAQGSVFLALPVLLPKNSGPPRAPARRILCDQHRRIVAYSIPNYRNFVPRSCRGRPCVVPIGCVMIQSLPRAADCYATTTQCARPCGSERASGSIIDGSGQEEAIAGRPAHDHWMNSPSSGRIQPTIRCDELHLCRSIHRHADCRPERSFFSEQRGGRIGAVFSIQLHECGRSGVPQQAPTAKRARVRNISECWFRRIGDASRTCRA